MGYDLTSIFKNAGVPNLGTTQVQRIRLDLIDEDSRNFYSMNGVQALADNIAIAGLLDPLRVRPAEDGRYTLVSGHRRRAACKLLGWAEADCIVEQSAMSPEMEELRLIFANKDTRNLSPADLDRQAQRVEALIPALKEQGFDFPGRTADWVAKLCDTNKTKIGNLKYIREHLAPELKAAYESGDMPLDLALHLAKCRQADQAPILGAMKKFYCISASSVDTYAEKLQKLDALLCGMDGCEPCSNLENRRRRVLDRFPYSSTVNCIQCCKECSLLADCQYACPKLADEIEQIKADRERQLQDTARRADEQKAARRAEEYQKRKTWAALWRRFGEAREAAGVSADEISLSYDSGPDKDIWACLESDAAATDEDTDMLPYGYWIDYDAVETLIDAADMLHCSLDYLLCRTDDPAPTANKDTEWQTGTPPKDGQYYICLSLFSDERPFRTTAYYDHGEWLYAEPSRSGRRATIEQKVVAWYPLPQGDPGA